MLIPLSRQEIFQASSFADHLIALYQQSYASDFDKDDKADAATLKKYYDHLQPFAVVDKEPEGHCVMALEKESLSDYKSTITAAIQQLFTSLNISKLYWIDFLNTGLLDYPFNNYNKRNVLKKLLKGNLNYKGFSFDVAAINTVLPLFIFDRNHYRPRVFIISADGDVHLSMNICKDGNFHCNYKSKDEQAIHAAAAKAGFTVGDVDICWNYSVAYLPVFK